LTFPGDPVSTLHGASVGTHQLILFECSVKLIYPDQVRAIPERGKPHHIGHCGDKRARRCGRVDVEMIMRERVVCQTVSPAD
jgi:hypothetical protein